MVRAFGVAIEREMLLDDPGAERDRGERNFEAVGVIGISDGKLECVTHRRHRRQVHVLQT